MSSSSSTVGISNIHQRDGRTQLFSTSRPVGSGPQVFAQTGFTGKPSVLGHFPYGASKGNFQGGQRVMNEKVPQYSSASVEELESQSSEHIDNLFSKVKILKNVTHRIGDEIRESSKYADVLNDKFEFAGSKLKATYNRMMKVSREAGVGWKTWLVVFGIVILFFLFVRWF